MYRYMTRREFGKRIGWLSATAAGYSLGMAACTNDRAAPAPAAKAVETKAPAPSPTPARPSKWTVVLSEDTGGGDPFTEYGTNSQFYLQAHVLEALVHIELLPAGNTWGVVNDLADSLSFPDGKTLLVALKKGVKFHNGEELTAEHVQYAFDSIVKAEKPGRRASNLKPLGVAEVVDRYTVRWQMPAPDVGVLRVLNHLLIPPLARKGMTAEEFEKKPIGTGPYKAVEYARDRPVRLEAWDGYRRGKPFPEELVVRYVADPSTRTAELLAGQAQIAQRVPIEALAAVQANPNLQVTSLRGGSSLTYVINIFKTSPPLRDKRVRQAMNYAVDRAAITKTILGGLGTPLPGPLWPGWIGHSEEVRPYPYDPDKARALLKDAGYPDGFSFRWTITQGAFAKDVEIPQAAAEQLSKVGIKATLQTTERARLLAERDEGDYDVTELNWTMGWDPAAMLANSLTRGYPDAKLSPKWGPPPAELVEARNLLRDAGATTDLTQRTQTYARLNRLMHDEAFWLFIHTADEVFGIQKDIGWRPYPVNSDNLAWYDYWGLLGKKAPSEPNVPLILR